MAGADFISTSPLSIWRDETRAVFQWGEGQDEFLFLMMRRTMLLALLVRDWRDFHLTPFSLD